MLLHRRLFLFALSAPLYSSAPLRHFNAGEARLIEALCDQIIPQDADGPGAKFAGVLFYIDQQIAGPLNRYAGNYRAGLAALDRACQQKTGERFVSLGSDAQTRFLTALESGGDSEALDFFTIVTEHTMQGFYGSSAHGGNRDEVSWKMLGIQEMIGGH